MSSGLEVTKWEAILLLSGRRRMVDKFATELIDSEAIVVERADEMELVAHRRVHGRQGEGAAAWDRDGWVRPEISAVGKVAGGAR